MCGIIGIIGKAPVTPLLVDALKRLEYRGYDSAGVATLINGHIDRRRAEGKLVNLEARLKAEPLTGTIGIGHTRWATHGKPSGATRTRSPPTAWPSCTTASRTSSSSRTVVASASIPTPTPSSVAQLLTSYLERQMSPGRR